MSVSKKILIKGPKSLTFSLPHKLFLQLLPLFSLSPFYSSSYSLLFSSSLIPSSCENHPHQVNLLLLPLFFFLFDKVYELINYFFTLNLFPFHSIKVFNTSKKKSFRSISRFFLSFFFKKISLCFYEI